MWAKIETYKEKAGTEGSSDLRHGAVLELSDRCRNCYSYSNPFRVSERVGRRGRDDNVHLHMPLAEFPLYLVLIPSVEIGFDGDNGLGIFFPTSGCFVLDIHDEQSIGVEAAEGGKSLRAKGETRLVHWMLYIPTTRQFKLPEPAVVPIIREGLHRIPTKPVLTFPEGVLPHIPPNHLVSG